MSPIRSETIALQHPGIAALPRVSDRLTFLHVDHAMIFQDDTGVVGLFEEKGVNHRVSIPTAAIAAILLGPGVSITQAALSTITRHGTALLWTGADGSRVHGWSYSLTSSARWAEAQATLWANPETRLALALKMYEWRFGGLPPGGTITLRRLRGLEGQRMKTLYRSLSSKHRIPFRRDYDSSNFSGSDPVNQALSSANAALYGVAAAAIVALGCHPALGFVHSGSISSFVFDVADLYKAQVSIPAAFAAAGSNDPGGEARRLTRQAMVTHGTLSKAVKDIQELLSPGLKGATGAPLALLDDKGRFVEAGVNYASDIEAGK
jgi:CRISPR-associated protein Cas1